MANNEKWVNDRLNALTPPEGWKPDAPAALARLREHDRVYRAKRSRWMWSGMAASLLCLGVFLTPAKCAFGVCKNNTTTLAPAEQTKPPAAVPAPAIPAKTQAEQRPVTPPVAQKPAATATKASEQQVAPAEPHFKESGNPDAPITCEIFTDYQCPHCATIYDQIVPMLRAEYVQTGKMKMVHRDFPLPMHAFARIAARYANAAGTIGRYEVVVNQIFRTQPIWAQNGDVDSQVAQILSPEEMDKVRELVRSDTHLDDTVAVDTAVGRQDNLNQTPTLVILYKGKQQVLAPVPPYSLLKSYLDELLTK